MFFRSKRGRKVYHDEYYDGVSWSTEGEVLIDGHDILKEPKEAKKHIGYLPEIPPLYVDMQVMEYLEFAAELKGIPKQQRESAIDEVIQMANLRM